jgi:hypothetical protein
MPNELPRLFGGLKAECQQILSQESYPIQRFTVALRDLV